MCHKRSQIEFMCNFSFVELCNWQNGNLKWIMVRARGKQSLLDYYKIIR